MRLTNLATHLRSWGLKVIEVEGWEHRGADFPSKPHVVVWHHTGTPQSRGGDYPSLAIVRDGRSDLPGPLSQIGLGRSGTVYVIAAGKANHAGRGSWRGHNVGNSDSIGIEAESPGNGTWTPAQRTIYPRLAAALHALLGTGADLSCGHRESALPAGRKVDPTGIDMPAMRSKVAALLAAGPAQPAPARTPIPEGRPLTNAELIDAIADEVTRRIRDDLLRLGRYLRGQSNSLFNPTTQQGLPEPKDCAS